MFVLDASAILAVLLKEDGADVVVPHLRAADVSIINVCEVLTKAAEQGGDVDIVQQVLDGYGFRIRGFRDAHARQSAALRPITKQFGLGFGDRACLVQGMFSGRPILTGDRDWMKLDLDLDIRLIRLTFYHSFTIAFSHAASAGRRTYGGMKLAILSFVGVGLAIGLFAPSRRRRSRRPPRRSIGPARPCWSAAAPAISTPSPMSMTSRSASSSTPAPPPSR